VTEPLLAVAGLTVELPSHRGATRVVDDVHLDIAPGEIVGLAGESGSGKSITALSIMGLLSRRARVTGSVRLAGRDLLSMSRRQLATVRGNDIAMVFQDPMSSFHPAFRVGDQIAEAVRRHRGVGKAAARARAVEMLERVGIPDPARRASAYPHEYSGGMLQRAMLAMALSCDPRLLIADEPTTALDVTVQAQVLELLAELHDATGLAILLISHDLGVLAEICERITIMYAGQIAEDSPAERFFAGPRHPYASALLRCAPHPVGKGEPLEVIPGAPPAPGKWPTGCRFAARCGHCAAACVTAPVELREPVAGTAVRCVRTDELGPLPIDRATA
jgi:oligopeptide/dipeptide ABC transporter ATP-binding protein